jgi:hypothetical protein
MELCVNCKYHENIEIWKIHTCIRKNTINGFSLITGEPKYNSINLYCNDERKDKWFKDTCGEEGKYFMQKLY